MPFVEPASDGVVGVAWTGGENADGCEDRESGLAAA